MSSQSSSLSVVKATAPIRIGVIGCGYWGANHVRCFVSLSESGAEMAIAADRNRARRDRIAGLYPSIRTTDQGQAIIEDPSIDAVVVATPALSHYELVRDALDAGKHVLVEKPFVTEVRQAEALIELARDRSVVLMIGHTFEYSAAVNHMRSAIRTGEIGDVRYIRSQRVNLGLFRTDINVLWDLAPHDVSILLYLLGAMPTHVNAVGTSSVTRGVEDVVSLTLEFGESLMANVIVSWLDPRKIREMTIVGNRKMLVYDDLSRDEKIKVFDRGVVGPSHRAAADCRYSYRNGDITTPSLTEYEPLRSMCSHFLDCVRSGSEARSSGAIGLQVVRVLSAAQRSLRQGFRRVALSPRENHLENLTLGAR